jgi:hypothetical protein
VRERDGAGRDDVRSTEAGLKYFVLGALSSGMLLYGASLVYGFLVDVRRPHVERHGGELERHAGGDEHHAEHHADPRPRPA